MAPLSPTGRIQISTVRLQKLYSQIRTILQSDSKNSTVRLQKFYSRTPKILRPGSKNSTFGLARFDAQDAWFKWWNGHGASSPSGAPQRPQSISFSIAASPQRHGFRPLNMAEKDICKLTDMALLSEASQHFTCSRWHTEWWFKRWNGHDPSSPEGAPQRPQYKCHGCGFDIIYTDTDTDTDDTDTISVMSVILTAILTPILTPMLTPIPKPILTPIVTAMTHTCFWLYVTIQYHFMCVWRK